MTKRILDIGCGDGSVAEACGWNLPGADYVGLDVDETAVEAARDRGLDARRVDVSTGLPFEENRFDYVLAKAVLEHLENPGAVVRECYRVLRAGGRLRVIVPSDRSYDVWGDPTHRRAYRRDALRQQLEDAGFDIMDVDGRMGWSSVGQAVKSCYRILAPWTPYGYPRAWNAAARKPVGASGDVEEVPA